MSGFLPGVLFGLDCPHPRLGLGPQQVVVTMGGVLGPPQAHAV